MKATQYITVDMGPGKRIALVAHDNMKQEMIDWAMEHARSFLSIPCAAPAPPPGWSAGPPA